MRKRPLISRIMIFLAITGVLFSCTSVSSFAQNNEEFKVAGYDVIVNINRDGSADITENIDFSFYDGFNNIMIPISKNEGEEIYVGHVYMLTKDGFTDCKRLLAGQWDAEVFTGTYSVIDEANYVKLKLYGSFYQSFGSVTIQYKVRNAVKRYKDVAEYNRVHIPKIWETRISDINITINLPDYVEAQDLNYWLNGVFVGTKKLTERKMVIYNVPDTVPGEYVQTRVLFPQNFTPDSPVTEDKLYLASALQEEAEYEKSDKTDLLKARETAARNAALDAYNQRLNQRAKNIFSVISLLLCALAVYYTMFMQRKLRHNKNMAMPPVFHNIERLDPSEVRLLLSNGRTGARAVMGKILQLAAEGHIIITPRRSLDNKTRLTFTILPDDNLDSLDEADRSLLEWIAGLSKPGLEFDPIQLLGHTDSEEKARELKRTYDEWVMSVKEAYNGKNILDVGIVKYRNIGIVGGTLLLFLGFIIPITLSIAAGYALIPAGLFLLMYSLRIRKHTDYGVLQHRIWKTLKRRMSKNSIALDALPEWMRPATLLTAYSVAMGIEKDAVRIISGLPNEHSAECGCIACSVSKHKDGNLENSDLYGIIRNTLKIFDDAVSSVQDAE